MLYKVDFSIEAWRWIFPLLYKRIEAFSASYNGSIEVVQARLAALVQGDPYTILLVNTEPDDISQISAHALCVIQPLDAEHKYVFVEQLESDTGHAETFVKACIAYAEQVLAPQYNITQLTMTTSESKFRAFKKKYGFETHRVLMVKQLEV